MFYPECLESRQLLAAVSSDTKSFHLVASCTLSQGFTLPNPAYAILSGGSFIPDQDINPVVNPAIVLSSPIDTSVLPPKGLNQFEYTASITLELEDNASNTLGQCTLTGQSGQENGTAGDIPTGFAGFVQSVGVPVVTAGLGGIQTSTSSFPNGAYALFDAPNASITFTQDNHQATARLSFAAGAGATLTLSQGSTTAQFNFNPNPVTSGPTAIRHINIALDLLTPSTKQDLTHKVLETYPAF